ncbi:hypothetical protein GCM10027074_24660 [Streptomyces deserti]
MQVGDASWRYPFFGTAFLMAVGFLCIAAFLKEQPKPARRTSLLDPVTGARLRRPHHGRRLHGPVRAFIGVNNTVYTELALGVSDAPRPVASAGYNFVRWFAAAAAPCFAPKIEEWSDIRIPFVVAAVTAVAVALVVVVRRKALTHEAEEPATKHATEDGVAVFVN